MIFLKNRKKFKTWWWNRKHIAKYDKIFRTEHLKFGWKNNPNTDVLYCRYNFHRKIIEIFKFLQFFFNFSFTFYYSWDKIIMILTTSGAIWTITATTQIRPKQFFFCWEDEKKLCNNILKIYDFWWAINQQKKSFRSEREKKRSL